MTVKKEATLNFSKNQYHGKFSVPVKRSNSNSIDCKIYCEQNMMTSSNSDPVDIHNLF